MRIRNCITTAYPLGWSQLAIAVSPAMQVPYPPPIISFFPEMDRPKSFLVTEDPTTLSIRCRRRPRGTIKALAVLLFCTWVNLLLADRSAAIVLLFWSALCVLPILRFLHTLTITATASGITVKSAPVPWIGNARFNREKMRQIFCVQKACRSGQRELPPTYAVKIMTARGRIRTLISGFETIGQARFIEQQLERFLVLTDAEIEGEYGR